MVTIVIKPAKKNSRSRRYRATGEYFAMKDRIRAEERADELLEQNVARALMGSDRVYKAVMPEVPGRRDDAPVKRPRRRAGCRTESGLSACGRQKVKGKSIPLI